jgi:hypothetical protein
MKFARFLLPDTLRSVLSKEFLNGSTKSPKASLRYEALTDASAFSLPTTALAQPWLLKV